MQLEGATPLERQLYETCLRVEQELPASELETAIVIALSEAGEALQQLRARPQAPDTSTKAAKAVVVLTLLKEGLLRRAICENVIFDCFGRWTERTTTHICRETHWVRFDDGSRICSANGEPWEVAVPIKQQRQQWKNNT